MTDRSPNIYEAFLDKLHNESLPGYLEVQRMRYTLAAQLQLNEADALELTCTLLAAQPTQRKPRRKRLTTIGALPGVA